MKTAIFDVHTANVMIVRLNEKVLPSKPKFPNFTYKPLTTIINITLCLLLLFTTFTHTCDPLSVRLRGCEHDENLGSHFVHNVHTSKNNKLS